ncbi:MAG: RNA polymerase sigma factor, partial [Acidobacteriia bacterium]|nr:RNA polymerase sigma factor [Terriglobia bacterium]
ALADDLLQETFFRFLRTSLPPMTLPQQRSYLFKISTRLIQDHWRHTKRETFWFAADSSADPASSDPAPAHLQRREMAQHFLGLTPQERTLLWLAYVEGSQHNEIAETLGLKSKSIRVLLFRARRKLATLIRGSEGKRGGL